MHLKLQKPCPTADNDLDEYALHPERMAAVECADGGILPVRGGRVSFCTDQCNNQGERHGAAAGPAEGREVSGTELPRCGADARATGPGEPWSACHHHHGCGPVPPGRDRADDRQVRPAAHGEGALEKRCACGHGADPVGVCRQLTGSRPARGTRRQVSAAPADAPGLVLT